jgi:hypothetical protein
MLSDLSPVQARVVLALAQGETVTKAAHGAEIHRTTIRRWINGDPAFVAALRDARDQYVETLQDEMKDLSNLALAALRRLLEDPATPASVRLRAALAVLERPSFPQQGWNLPESINSPQEDDLVNEFALVDRDFEILRKEEALRKRPARDTGTPPPPDPPQIPRSAPCPCGSGLKYKRCCGKDASPVLHPSPPSAAAVA